MKTSNRQKFLIFASLILAFNGFIGYAVYKSDHKLQESEQWVQHTKEVISKSENILSLGKDIESASRGFVITNDSTFLEPLFNAEKTIFININELRQLTRDNSLQQRHVDSISLYVQKRLDFSIRQTELRSKQGLASAIAYTSTKLGLTYSNRIRQITSAIQQEEATLLKQRKQTNERSLAAFNLVSGIMFILMTVFTLFLLYVTNKYLLQIKEKEKRAAELIIANDELVFQNKEKEKRAAELIIANKELAFQNREKEKRADELIIANKELLFQNEEKEKRADELIIANKELAFQNREKEKRAAELIIANKELVFQNEEKGKRAEELIIAKEKAEESDRLKSAFLANMSHEIRTPLNGILGFSTLLKEPELTGEDQEFYIDIIEKSGVRLLNIINDILNISKIESGQMAVSISETNINEQIEEIYTFLKPEAEQKGLQISFKNTLPEKEATIKTDKEKFYAILTNLVKNAIKFTKTGSIEFGYGSTSSPTGQEELEFFVKDTGIGIHPEQLEIVFERFRQGSESLNKK